MSTQFDPTKVEETADKIVIFDNTKLSDFDSCQRYFFLRHELGWRPTGISIDLIFGSAWHAAMDIVWDELCSKPGIPGPKYGKQEHLKLTDRAEEAFMESWRENNGPDPSEQPDILDKYVPKTPMIAADMIYEYIQEKWAQLGSFELLAIEQPFAVPLDITEETLQDPTSAKYWYAGRIDKIIKESGRIVVVDHKTTKAYQKDGYFRNYFAEAFDINTQFEGYAYAVHLLYGDDYRGDVWADGALCHKKVHNGFRFLPTLNPIESIDGWRWETLDKIRQILDNRNAVELTKDMEIESPYLPAFRRNPGNCYKWMRPCAFKDICLGNDNPLEYVEEGLTQVPLGFIEEHWFPFDILELDKIGLKADKVVE